MNPNNTSFNDIIYEKKENIAIIKLNRPEVLNAVRDSLWREIEKAVADVQRDESVRVLIFTGEGRAFSVGADIKELGQLFDQEVNLFDMRTSFVRMQQVTKTLIEMPKPTIAAVNGYALGAGAELAILCDIRIASDKARIGFPEVKVGLYETNGVTHILPRLVGLGKAKELMMIGEFIDAEEARRIGLVEKVVPHKELMIETLAMANKIAANAPVSVSLVKAGLNRGAHSDLDTALIFETEALMACILTEDAREGALAFLEDREPEFKGK
jgi:enoyl-CoA hydratase